MNFLISLHRSEKITLSVALAIAIFFAVPTTAEAMHIMEGYLPIGFCIAWGAVCVPFLVYGVMRIRRIVAHNRRALILLAMSGAFIFVLSSLKLPSVTGSCSHMTGTGLSAVLFGAGTTSILGIIVLIFQAILLAHGGLTTLGANTFSMAIGGPLLTVFLMWLLSKRLKVNKKVAVFFACMLGDWFTYCITAFQLALAYPTGTTQFTSASIGESVVKFLGVYAPTQLPLSIVEGILSVLIIIAMERFATRELRSLSWSEAN
ncbi:MAG: energy-coupling factor ABC transporter permease [Coriobacteriia bacterium]|nr:energy-coupling factor ABC transporter permease [Coriobacteriia bacterium]